MVQDIKLERAAIKIVLRIHACLSWKNQTLTPNPDSIYFMPFFDTKDVGQS